MASPSSSSTQWNAIAALVSVKLTRDNYLLWSSQLESIMESQELVHFIDGTFPPSPDIIMKDGKSEANPYFSIRKRSDRLALSWIKATVLKPVLRQIISSKSTHEAWKTLKKSFGSQPPLRIMLLKKEQHFIQKGNMDMRTYLERIKFLADTLATTGIDTDDNDLVQITMNEVETTLGVGKEVDSKDEEDNLFFSLNYNMNIRTTMQEMEVILKLL
ncbi:hypothetical protein EJ110_NYTH24450 [Nymphaea thermarum]|nr:hypothetical protein EJ110_NYTH24450 [Nymphaea thermarum]